MDGSRGMWWFSGRAYKTMRAPEGERRSVFICKRRQFNAYIYAFVWWQTARHAVRHANGTSNSSAPNVFFFICDLHIKHGTSNFARTSFAHRIVGPFEHSRTCVFLLVDGWRILREYRFFHLEVCENTHMFKFVFYFALRAASHINSAPRAISPPSVVASNTVQPRDRRRRPRMITNHIACIAAAR